MPDDDTEYWGWPEIRPRVYHMGTNVGSPSSRDRQVGALCVAAYYELGIGEKPVGYTQGSILLDEDLPKQIQGHTVAYWCPRCQNVRQAIRRGEGSKRTTTPFIRIP